MQQNGMAKVCIIYNIILDRCMRHGCSDLADELFEDMQRQADTCGAVDVVVNADLERLRPRGLIDDPRSCR